MDLLLGFGVMVFLIFFTIVIAFLIEYSPKEVPQLLIGIMMIGDGALAGVLVLYRWRICYRYRKI